jgi:hypothetical protein
MNMFSPASHHAPRAGAAGGECPAIHTGGIFNSGCWVTSGRTRKSGRLFARRQPGDTIGIPPDYTVTIGRVCDFTQPVVVVRTKVVCVLRASRGVRATD